MSDIVLEFCIFYATRVAQNVEHHLFCPLNVLRDCREVVGKGIMIRWQTERRRKRLIARVTMCDRIQRTDAWMSLRVLQLGSSSHGPKMKGVNCWSFFSSSCW